MEFKIRYRANEDTVVRFAKTFPRVEDGGIVYLYPLIDKNDGCRADFVYREGMIEATVKTKFKRKKAEKKVRSFLEKKCYVDGVKLGEATSHENQFIIKASI